MYFNNRTNDLAGYIIFIHLCISVVDFLCVSSVFSVYFFFQSYRLPYDYEFTKCGISFPVGDFIGVGIDKILCHLKMGDVYTTDHHLTWWGDRIPGMITAAIRMLECFD